MRRLSVAVAVAPAGLVAAAPARAQGAARTNQPENRAPPPAASRRGPAPRGLARANGGYQAASNAFSRIGAGATLRFTRGTAESAGPGDTSIRAKAGELQVGAGLRLHF